jgi:hypothetical protein
LACWGKLGIQWDVSVNISDHVLHIIGTIGISCIMEIFVFAAWEI